MNFNLLNKLLSVTIVILLGVFIYVYNDVKSENKKAHKTLEEQHVLLKYYAKYSDSLTVHSYHLLLEIRDLKETYKRESLRKLDSTLTFTIIKHDKNIDSIRAWLDSNK